MSSRAERGARFAALHEGPPFVIPNPYDAGSARVLEAAGFEALATSSSGYAFTLGRADGTVHLDEMAAHVAALTGATDLPVSADLENGYGADPAVAANTIATIADAGAVGGSIEDATGDAAKPIYDFSLAVERVAAAVEEARKLPFPFTLVARAENFLHGRPDFDDTARRLQAFAAAGADVLYAPAVRDLQSIRTVVAAVPKPVNVVMGLSDPDITLEELKAAGVRRVSVGGALARLALAAVREAAVAMREQGSFRWVKDIMPAKELRSIFGR